MNVINNTIIGETSERADILKNYFTEKGIKARTVECNPLAIQYAAITDKPEAVLISDKTDYLESLCRYFQLIENAPVLFVITTSSDNKESLYELEQYHNVQIINSCDCNTLYTNLMNYANTIPQKTEEKTTSGLTDLHEEITDLLDRLDVTPNYNGYNCIREALKIAVQTQGRMPSVSKEIQPAVAKKLSVTSASVERSIRTAIKRSWEKITDSSKMKFFGSYALKEEWSPTNGEYIAIIAEKLKRKYKLA